MIPNTAGASEQAAIIEMHPTSYVPELVRRLYALVAELEVHFPGRPFTPDGHLVGSIGEVVAAHRYGLTLLRCSAESHDAVTVARLRVQIKATQATGVAMRSSCEHWSSPALADT